MKTITDYTAQGIAERQALINQQYSEKINAIDKKIKLLLTPFITLTALLAFFIFQACS